jgi:hypothetical protein
MTNIVHGKLQERLNRQKKNVNVRNTTGIDVGIGK